MVLVNKSLLQPESSGRYAVHELLRYYVAEQLKQWSDSFKGAHDRHSAYFANFLQQREADLKGPREQTTLAEIEAEIDNVQSAWNWAVAQAQVEALIQASRGLGLFYLMRGRIPEGEEIYRLAAERLEAMESSLGQWVLAKTLYWQAVFSNATGRRKLQEVPGQLLQRSLTILESPALAEWNTQTDRAFALLRLGHFLARSDDHERARQRYEASLALFERLDDQWGKAWVLDALGWQAANVGRNVRAKKLLEESLTIRRTLDDPKNIANSLAGLGQLALIQRQLEDGERLIRESNLICQQLGNQIDMAHGLRRLGYAFAASGKFDQAVTAYQEARVIYNDQGFLSYAIFAHILGCATKMHLGRYDEAYSELEPDLSLAKHIDDQWLIGDSSWLLLGDLKLAEGAYIEAQRLLQQSVETFEAAIGSLFADVLTSLACIALHRDKVKAAQDHLIEALRELANHRPDFRLRFRVISGVALLLARRGEKERSIELYALVAQDPFVANSRWYEDVFGRHIAVIAETLPPKVVAAAENRGRTRDMEATVAELLTEIEGW